MNSEKSSENKQSNKKEPTQIDSNGDKNKFVQDPLADLYQLEKFNVLIDKEELILITKLFDNIEEYYKLKRNIKELINEKEINENRIINFFMKIIKGTPNKYKLGSNNLYKDSLTKRKIWRLIFELPEVIKENFQKFRNL